MESTQCQVCGAFFIDKTSLDHHIESAHTKEELYSCILCLKTTLVQLVGQSRSPTNNIEMTSKPENHITANTDQSQGAEDDIYNSGVGSVEDSSNEGLVISHVTESEQNGSNVEENEKENPDNMFYFNVDDSSLANQNGNSSSTDCVQGEDRFDPSNKNNERDDHPYLFRLVGGKFICQFCQKEFTTNYALKRHIMSHYDNRPNKCDVCGKAFIGKQNLQVHYRIHTGEKPYKCKYCHKTFTQYGTLYRHTQLHLKGRLGGTDHTRGVNHGRKLDFTDLEQNKDFVNDMDNNDVNNEVGQDREINSDKEIKSMNDGAGNNVSIVDLTVVSQKDVQNSNSNSSALTDIDNTKDEQCNFDSVESDGFNSYKDIENVADEENNSVISNDSNNETNPTLDSQSGEICGIPNTTNAYISDSKSVKELVKGENSNIKGVLQINENGQELEDLTLLNKFENEKMNNFTGIKNLESELNNSESTSASLSLHKRSGSLVTDKMSPVADHPMDEIDCMDNKKSLNIPNCDICNIVLDSMESLESHQSLHRNGNLHRCLVCGKSFSMSYTLRRHMMIHTGEKPHKCDVCGKGFIEKQHLQSHYRIHTGEKPYKCNFCEKRFTQYGTLHNHLQTHKNREMFSRQGEATNVFNNSADEMELSSNFSSISKTDETFETSSIPSDLTIYNTKFESGNMYIKQEVQSDGEDDRVDGETEEGMMGKEINLKGDEITNSNVNTEEHLSKQDSLGANISYPKRNSENAYFDTTQNIHLKEIKQESFEPESRNSLMKSRWSVKDFLAQYQANRNIPFNSMNQLPGIASFTSNHGNSLITSKHSNALFTGNHGNSLINFHLTCKFCLQVFSNQDDLQLHMQVHLTSFNVPPIQPESTGFSSSNDDRGKEVANLSKVSSDDVNEKKSSKPHRCTVCGKGYQAKYCLRRHMFVHYGEKPFKCQICGRGFIEKQHLTIHFRIHTGEKPYECKFCGKKFTQYGTLHNHLNTHKRKGMCVNKGSNDTAASPRKLLEQPTSNGNEGIDLKVNKLDQNEENDNINGKSQSINVTESQEESSQNLKCNNYRIGEIENKISRSDAESHLNNFHSESVKEDTKGGISKSYMTHEINSHVTEDESASLKNMTLVNHGDSEVFGTSQDNCHKLDTATSINSQNHNQEGVEEFSKFGKIENITETDEESETPFVYNCEVCNESFYGKRNWKAHMKFHLGDGTCRCDICGKHCSGEQALKRHSMVHSGLRPHKCDICGKGFMEKQHLQIHRRIHTGEKPYKCNICDKRFTQYGTLHKHNRIHTKDKPYKCQYCVKSFGERRQLLHHMATIHIMISHDHTL